MALHPNFPDDPHAGLDPSIRWFPADESLRESGSDKKLMPPLVPELRKLVKAWRDDNYAGATDTSRSLLNWWFKTEQLLAADAATELRLSRSSSRKQLWLGKVAPAKCHFPPARQIRAPNSSNSSAELRHSQPQKNLRVSESGQ